VKLVDTILIYEQGEHNDTMHYVYAIKSQSRNYIYVGMTQNFDRRLQEHNNGKEITTRPYRPFKLLFLRGYPNRIEARKGEKYYKSGIGKEHLKKLPGW